jgi:hypothetical protein
MGGQGFIPEDGQGGIVEGTKESKKLEQQPDAPFANAFGGGGAKQANGPAPRAGMQGTQERGNAPSPILPRPGTTPAGGRTDVHRTTEQSANTTGTGNDIDTGD